MTEPITKNELMEEISNLLDRAGLAFDENKICRYYVLHLKSYDTGKYDIYVDFDKIVTLRYNIGDPALFINGGERIGDFGGVNLKEFNRFLQAYKNYKNYKNNLFVHGLEQERIKTKERKEPEIKNSQKPLPIQSASGTTLISKLYNNNSTHI